MPDDSFRELEKALEQQLVRSARFVPSAFHIHSPESHDWAERPGADRHRNDRQRLMTVTGVDEYVSELALEFRVACVTDHMRTTYACRAAAAAALHDDVVVFPGAEVNYVGGQLGNSRIHLLAIFPPTATPTTIDRIFADHRGGGPFASESDRTGLEEFHGPPLREWADAIHAQGGIFLVAHVDDPKSGQRHRFRAIREATLGYERTASGSDAPLEVQQQVAAEYLTYIAELQPDAIEVTRADHHQHYVAIPGSDGRPRRIACVMRSDPHCVEEFARPERKTYVKVSRLDFECVRDALRFSETRVRFEEDLPETPSPRLLGLRLQSPSGDGLFRNATLAFNENLNCIIGPRGAGKSTIIEALRYVFGLNGALAAAPAVAGQTTFADLARRLQQVNLPGTLLEAIYEVSPSERHHLVATYDEEAKATTRVFLSDGTELHVATESLPLQYPLRLYSWSEIETLGRQPHLQRELLDRFVPDLGGLKEDRNQLIQALRENRSDIEGLIRRLETLLEADSGLLTRYRQYKTEFDQINTEEVAALFADLDRVRAQVQLLEHAETAAKDLQAQLQAVDDAATLPDFGLDLPDDAELSAWWESEIGPSLTTAEEGERLRAGIRNALAVLETRAGRLLELRASREEAMQATESDLRQRTQADPSEEIRHGQREERKARFDRASARRDEYLAVYAEVEIRLEERRRVAEQLEHVRDAVTNERGRVRDSLRERLDALDTSLEIDIDLQPGADRKAAIEYLRDTGLLTRDPFGRYRERQIAERCCAMVRPTSIVRAVLDRDINRLTEEGLSLDDDRALTTAEATQFVDHFHPFGTNDDADVRIIDPRLARVLELEEQPIDDALRINLAGRPVDERSPGQRSSAMLPLVALAETAPLVIDQPEDNLDNRMVGETMTRILAALKERRQIIVTTHNPNIVVSGDAEQVLVLRTPEGHQAEIELTGSIDDGDVVQAVIDLMEGGREAFLTRSRRYGFNAD